MERAPSRQKQAPAGLHGCNIGVDMCEFVRTAFENFAQLERVSLWCSQPSTDHDLPKTRRVYSSRVSEVRASTRVSQESLRWRLNMILQLWNLQRSSSFCPISPYSFDEVMVDSWERMKLR